MASTRLSPVERLRRIWTPEREIDEIFSDLSPASALDSQIREWFSRIIDAESTVTIDLTEPVPPFNIRWNIVHHEDSGRREVTIWKEQA